MGNPMEFDKILKEMKVTRYHSKYFPPTKNKNNLDWSEYSKKFDNVQNDMKLNGTWYEDGHNYDFRKATSRDIVLGRYQFYVQFADFLYEKYGKRFYLLDYMARIDNDKESGGLLYYILSADEIHINLEGISREELSQATVGLGRLANNLKEIQAKFTTAWEINQVFYRSEILKRTTFHTGSQLTRKEVFDSMNHKVPINKILDDNKNLMNEE